MLHLPYASLFYQCVIFLCLKGTSAVDQPPVESENNNGNDAENKDMIQSIYEDNQSSLNVPNDGHESVTSFTFIGETNGSPMDTLSHKMKVLTSICIDKDIQVARYTKYMFIYFIQKEISYSDSIRNSLLFE